MSEGRGDLDRSGGDERKESFHGPGPARRHVLSASAAVPRRLVEDTARVIG
ncbi:hypothetical protein ACFVTC_40695 [Streptomyces sp. NPDC057950]|uniref:hypothetical protein n=1 Tax=Streptomyces sp. NPDC057950 TaxID=3346288 RepID=UPI0036E9DD65